MFFYSYQLCFDYETACSKPILHNWNTKRYILNVIYVRQPYYLECKTVDAFFFFHRWYSFYIATREHFYVCKCPLITQTSYSSVRFILLQLTMCATRIGVAYVLVKFSLLFSMNMSQVLRNHAHECKLHIVNLVIYANVIHISTENPMIRALDYVMQYLLFRFFFFS